MIDLTHLEGPGNTIIPDGAVFSGPRFDGFAALAAAAKRHGSLIVGQVSHPGRQVRAEIQPHPISASAVRLVKTDMNTVHGVPRAATQEDIRGVVEGFAHAAEFLDRAGFDGIMLHGAHGYLLSQFLSLQTNKRTDEYGGSLENRMRLILEIAAAIKKRVGKDFILSIKINSVEFQDQGFTPEEAVVLCQTLEKAEFDYIETSGGNYERAGFNYRNESTRRRESYFIEFAEQIARSISTTKVYTTGGFKTVAAMVDALHSVDGVGIGRASTQEPRLPIDILSWKINGIIKYALEEDQFGPRMLASTYQMHQLGRGEEPADLTDPEVVKKVLESMLKQMNDSL
ncbi:NADH oxidase [Biscogniauxia marginata]|nr:NADH oxidase [Biscogniauxia marginata]